jgi:GntR family transcriptional regulator
MNPQLERPPPPYVQIADRYRRMIHDGQLPEGTRLPAVPALAREYGVSNATAGRALAVLQGEGLIYTSPRGSVVAGQAVKGLSPQTRLLKSRHDGTTAAQGETHRVTAAGLVTNPPAYVRDYLDTDDPPAVIRREWITSEGDGPRILTVTWYPAALADQVPDLLSTDPESVGLILGHVEGIIGQAAKGRDWIHGRGADYREATALQLPTGTPVLAGTWMYWTRDGALIEYGEYVLPPRHTLSYPYDLTDPEMRDYYR